MTTAAGFAIRPATVEDAAGIARVHVASWRFAYPGLLPQAVLDALSIDDRAHTWAQRIARTQPRALTLVAIRDDRVAGFCSCGPPTEPDAGEACGYVAALYVDPAASRQGIGRLLMDAALDHLREHGYTSAELWVMKGNAIGIGFYEGYGWRPSGRTQVETLHGVDVAEIGYHLDIDTPA